jgi:sphingosine kinase
LTHPRSAELLAPKRLLTTPVRNLLRVRLSGSPHKQTSHHRLDLHTLLEKGKTLRLSVMHVLVEEANMMEAPLWLETAMGAGYAGWYLHFCKASEN